MNSIEQTYLSLLRVALHTDEEVNPMMQSADWLSVLHLAARQGTAALIAEQILLMPDMHLDKSLIMQLKAICAQTMIEQQRQKQILQVAWKALTSAGITPVLMKGLTLAHFYEKPYLRQCGDLDIYVGKDHYHDGAKVLRDTFPDAPRFDEEAEYFKHYNLNVGNTPIEMHRVTKVFQHPKDAIWYDCLEEDGMKRHYVVHHDELMDWNEPEYRFNVFFVFIHSWEHFVTESANIRQLCDIMMLLKAGGDYGVSTPELEKYLYDNLKALHLLQAWQLYAYIMVNYMGLSRDECPLYTDSCKNRSERLFRWIIDGRMHEPGTNGKAPRNIILRKLYTLRLRIREAQHIGEIEPIYARHMVVTAFAQSWDRFKRGENTRRWE